MKVQIWSDIVCPFCYIGKRNFESALKQFKDSDKIEVEWKSFELSPGLKTDPSKSTYEHLAEHKGWTLDYTKKVHDQVTQTAKNAGLEYNFDISIPANSFNAHRLLHLAKVYGMQNAVKERLFAAHFTEGKNIDDEQVLILIGTEAGIPEEKITEMLNSDLYADDVRADVYGARQIGVQGVPFFVLDNKYAVSGAQPVEAFLGALQQAWSEYEKPEPLQSLNTEGNAACDVDGNCN